jgi:ABC-2 type transport system ATP-binding protein
MVPRVVEVEGLKKSFRDFTAVDDVSLHVNAGEVFGLLGPNGAGKTTTMRMLLGILKPTAGTARIGGRDCFAEREHVARVTGYLPDEPLFHDYLRGREILDFVGHMHGLTSSAVKERSREILTTLEFGDALEEFATNYSRGMKKKLALACALLHDPQVLILDEPTSGLDPGATRRLHDMLRSLSERGVAILLSSHVLDQVEKLCARVAIIAHGKLAAMLSMEEVRTHATGSLEELFLTVTGHGSAAGSP